MTERDAMPHKEGQCPTCHAHDGFRWVSTQEYPAAIARAAGFQSSVFDLFMCNHCHTSLLQPKPVMEWILSD
jgi:hypothetical protein